MSDRPLPPEPDFERLGRRLSEITSEIIHRPDRTWTTDVDLNAKALRVLLERTTSGFVTYREMMNTLNGHTVIDRIAMEAAQEQARAARAEADRVRADAAEDAALTLERWCNEATVPSRYRREGVELAVQTLRRVAAHHARRAGPTP